MTTVSSGQTLDISAGQTSSGIVVLSGGFLDVLSGGTAVSAVVSSGGFQFVFSGGRAISATIVGSSNTGGEQDIFSGGVASFTTVNGGSQEVSAGATAVETVLTNSGFQGIDGGVASLTTVSSGSFQDVFTGGTAVSTTISSGGQANIASGGAASEATVASGGVMFIYSGGTASGTTVESGGTLLVLPGATDNGLNAQAGSVIVSSGVSIFTFSNSESTATLVSGPVATLSGVAVSGAGISGLEAVAVLAGGTVSNAVIDDRGVMLVATGGVVVGTIISSGGGAIIGGALDSGGRAFPGGVDSNGTIHSGGSESVADGGVASATTVDSGGLLTVSSAGSAVVPVLSGGTVELGTGSTISGTVQFAGGGTLKIDFLPPPTNPVAGFTASGDTVDLTVVAFSGNTSVGFSSATDMLTVVEGGTSATLQLDAENYAGITWTAASDTGGGTDIAIACFLRGTLILTEAGEVAVEALAIGDKVMTLSGEVKPIRWIGQRAYDGHFIARNRAVLPIRVMAGALADAVPSRDLWVSPEHALYLDGVLVPARLLANGATISQVEGVERLEYFHIELATHDIIFAEGATAETFVDCDNRFMFHNAGEFAALYPYDRFGCWEFCAPRLEPGSAELGTIRAVLLARAEALGRVVRDPDLHLVADGEIVRAQSVAGQVYRFALPAGARAIVIASHSAVPAEAEASSADERALGVPIEQIVLCGAGPRIEIGHDCPALCDGFHADEGSHRWSDGRGRLPEALLAAVAGDVTVEVHLAETERHYPLNAPAVAAEATTRSGPARVAKPRRRRQRSTAASM